MNMNITQKLEGFYSLKVHGGKRGEIDFGKHKNMILDAGINHMLNGNDPFRYVHVGSGSSQPNAGQVQLDAKLSHSDRNKSIAHGYVSTGDSESGEAYGYSRLEVQFDRGAAKGNISEIGAGSNTQGNPLWSRSLILDKSGNPTSITILEDEYLTVTYEVRRYVNTEPVATTLQYDDDGEMKSVECSVIPSGRVDAYGWGSAGVSESLYLQGTSLTSPDSAVGKLVVSGGAASIDFTYSTHEANDIDIANPSFKVKEGNKITPIPVGTSLKFDPPLRKTNEFELTIGVTVTIERA